MVVNISISGTNRMLRHLSVRTLNYVSVPFSPFPTLSFTFHLWCPYLSSFISVLPKFRFRPCLVENHFTLEPPSYALSIEQMLLLWLLALQACGRVAAAVAVELGMPPLVLPGFRDHVAGQVWKPLNFSYSFLKKEKCHLGDEANPTFTKAPLLVVTHYHSPLRYCFLRARFSLLTQTQHGRPVIEWSSVIKHKLQLPHH